MSLAAGSHPRTISNGVMAHVHDASAPTNGHHVSTTSRSTPHPPAPATASVAAAAAAATATASSSASAAAPANKKQAKRQQSVASNEASKLVAQKIAQLELDQAGEKDQELEIEKEVRKANRELHSQTAKMDSLQKIDHLSKRCTELLHEMKRLERESQKNKKRTDQLQKERDQSRSELSKTIGLKEKLEKLCRELQKENNKFKNENRTLKGNEVANLNSWDQKYAALLQKLEDVQEEKDNPRKQVVSVEIDELFRQRFKSLIEQYELRELHFHSLMRTKELEVQYNMARFERERKRAEAEVALSRRLNEQVQSFSRTESELRNQLNLCVERFKKEMEQATTKSRKLEKDNDSMKRKQDAINTNVVQMAEERAENARLLELTKRQLSKLKSIVVMMQQQEARMIEEDSESEDEEKNEETASADTGAGASAGDVASQQVNHSHSHNHNSRPRRRYHRSWVSELLAANGIRIVHKDELTADGQLRLGGAEDQRPEAEQQEEEEDDEDDEEDDDDDDDEYEDEDDDDDLELVVDSLDIAPNHVNSNHHRYSNGGGYSEENGDDADDADDGDDGESGDNQDNIRDPQDPQDGDDDEEEDEDGDGRSSADSSRTNGEVISSAQNTPMHPLPNSDPASKQAQKKQKTPPPVTAVRK